MDPTFRAGVDAALETAINTALRYDPATRARLAQLDGRALALELTAPAMTLVLSIEGEQVAVHRHWEGEINTRLCGSGMALLRLLRERDATPAALGVSVTGSSALLAELQTILRDLDVDWEAPLAQLLGDIPAHTIGNALRNAGRWLRDNVERAPQASAEAISEEWQLTPPRAQFEDFAGSVADLSLATERLAARVELLRRKLTPQGDA